MPIALSVENSGAANTASNSPQRARSMELDATPPEKSTGSAGYRRSASRVADTTARQTESSAYRAVCASDAPAS